eukprot:GHVQ01031408.1.p1 GENE.GHVQ01031408.1~~GHVQ01031408.1.p1  ORF type:complete len:444 (-),score=111.31 GHVQ01031408.1:1303-2460(-)
MLEAKLNGLFFRRIIESISSILHDVNLVFHPTDGLTFSAMDTSKVCFIEASILVSKFMTYRCDEAVVAGMDLKHLVTALSGAGIGESSVVVLQIDSSEDNTIMTLLMDDAAEEYGNCVTVSLRLLSLPNPSMDLSDLSEYECNVFMQAKEFKLLIEMFKANCDTLRFKSSMGDRKDGKKKLVRKSSSNKESTKNTKDDQEESGDGGELFGDEGMDVDEGEVTDTDDNNMSEGLKISGGSSKISYLERSFLQSPVNRHEKFYMRTASPIDEVFGMKHLQEFSRLAALLPVVKIGLSSGQPMMVSYKITDTKEIDHHGFIHFFLAPRAKDEDERDPDKTGAEEEEGDEEGDGEGGHGGNEKKRGGGRYDKDEDSVKMKRRKGDSEHM